MKNQTMLVKSFTDSMLGSPKYPGLHWRGKESITTHWALVPQGSITVRIYTLAVEASIFAGILSV